MSIRFKAVKLKDNINPETPDMFIAVAKSRGITTLDELSKNIALMSTVSRADVYAVLIALCDSLPQALSKGNIVRLGHFGSFMIGLGSETAESSDEITMKKVNQIKLRFRPSKEIKNALKQFELEKI